MACPRILHSITVEPIVLCLYSSLSIYFITNTAILYEAICDQHYSMVVWVECSSRKLAKTHHQETVVQSEAVRWSMYLNVAGLIPMIFMDILLGSWGDKVGRKINILLGITGVCLIHVNGLMLASNHELHLGLLFPLGIAAYFSGYIALIPMSCAAYLSDITPDKDILTQRLVILEVSAGLARVIGGLLSGVLLARLPFEWVLLISESCLVFNYCYTVLRLKQVPPAAAKRKKFNEQNFTVPLPTYGSTQTSQSQSCQDTYPAEGKPQNQEGPLRGMWILLKEAAKTYAKPRMGKARTYIILTGLVYTLFLSVEFALGSQVASLYLFAAPFKWSPSKLGYFRSAQALVNIIGQLGGVLLAKTVLKLSETTMVLIGIVSLTAEMIMVGVSRNIYMMSVSAVLGMFSGLAIPSMQSFLAQLVGPTEVGKAFSVFGIASGVSVIFGLTVYNNIYSATVAWMPGFTFLFVAALSLSCFMVFMWVHFNYRRECNVLM